ncbi:transporter, major facilitator family protein [Ancylostoma caninum]|uniref:Transporter, major facilitator family protein n=1 Tax=Ancylostoma caninum TaxID=29170 RepID=A0A368FUH9_ANCCA|nr:transporter, major facilitator family protein [Ancylostoma caninum]
MVYTIGGDRVAPKQDDPLEAIIVQFPEQPKKISFDLLLVQHLGNFGRYQLLQFVLLCLPTIFVAMHVMSWAFVAVPPEVICANSTISENCTTVGYSAVDRWDMYDDRSWIKATVQSLYYIGQMTGSLFCGVMGDKIGRKRVFYLAIVIQTLCGTLLTVAPTWWLFAMLKAGTGFSQPGIFGVAVVLGMELVGAKYRRLGAVVAGAFYAFGEMILAGMAYAITDYRILHAAIALPSLIFLSYWWLVPESARWLVTKERYEEADVILHKAARINGSYVPDRWWEQLEMSQNSKYTSFGLFDLVRTPKMRMRTLICFFLWPVNTMMYYGLTMKSDLGGGNLYINFAISAAMEIPALFVVYFLIDRIGRRQIVAGSLATAGICLVLNWIIGDDVSFYWGMLQMMITKGAVTVSYTAMYTYTSELFPTVIRNTAVGCCSTIARVGAIMSSYMALWLVEAYGKLAMVIPFSLLSLIAAILTAVFLPETMDKPMPESISEVEGTKI